MTWGYTRAPPLPCSARMSWRKDADQQAALFAELEEVGKFDNTRVLHYARCSDALVDISPYRDKLLDFLRRHDEGVSSGGSWLKNDPEIERW